MADETRARLGGRLAAGDPEAFAELYDRCAARMLAVARSLTGSAAGDLLGSISMLVAWAGMSVALAWVTMTRRR